MPYWKIKNKFLHGYVYIFFGGVEGIIYNSWSKSLFFDLIYYFFDLINFLGLIYQSWPNCLINFLLGMRPMTGTTSRATTAQATSRAKSAPGKRPPPRSSPNPSVVVVSTPDNSRPSTASPLRIHPSSLFRPASSPHTRKGARSPPDATFKTRLSSWKEEIWWKCFSLSFLYQMKCNSLLCVKYPQIV